MVGVLDRADGGLVIGDNGVLPGGFSDRMGVEHKPQRQHQAFELRCVHRGGARLAHVLCLFPPGAVILE